MPVSDYIKQYITEAKTECKRAEKLKCDWLQEFFEKFYKELNKRSNGAAPGDKYIITGAFSEALESLVPQNKLVREVKLSDYITLPEDKSLSDLLSKKRIDFAIEGKTKILLIEFKTNVQFNDVAAAMIEMLAVKTFAPSNSSKEIITASLHLFPYTTNVNGLCSLNNALGKPLDNIWVLCTPEQQFDIDTITSFRDQVLKLSK